MTAAWFDKSITKEQLDALDERTRQRYGKVVRMLRDELDMDISMADADIIEFLEENENRDMVIDHDESEEFL